VNLGLDIPAIEKMPGGDVLRLVRDILNDEAFRVSTLEELLVKNGVAGSLNAERVAVVRALHASSSAITLMLAAAQQTSRSNELTRTRREFVKLIADQMRAALIAEEGKGADHGAAA
jgi:hypothetical protein